MPPKDAPMPPAIAIVMLVVYLLFLGGMLGFSIIMLVAWWKAMRAHQKIAEKLGEIADKLPLK
jgi:glucose-6-phosphate dehydrogenase assembly protein OpcA